MENRPVTYDSNRLSSASEQVNRLTVEIEYSFLHHPEQALRFRLQPPVGTLHFLPGLGFRAPDEALGMR